MRWKRQQLSSPLSNEDPGPAPNGDIRTPDQRVRVFVSSTLQELAPERAAARAAIALLRLTPIMFEIGARPHPARSLYRAYLQQSHIFVGIYWQRYGWVAPDMTISGLEDEYRLSGNKPKLIYIKYPAHDREQRLQELINTIQADDAVSYKPFSGPDELRDLLAADLASMLTERFEMARLAATLREKPSGDEETAPGTGSLPVFRGAMVGHEKELAAAQEMLLHPDTGLVTMIGTGGTGKTRLAVQVAAQLQEEFRDGVRFVALESVQGPELALSAIANALGVMETGDTRLLESLKENLAGKQVLLVLDNFEHLTAAAPSVAALLEACNGLKVLVTSRRPLRVRGEREFPVPPLALPDPGQSDDPRQLSRCAAVRLFVDRARDINPNFELTQENAQAVSEICRRLDGLPLAIELAAARIKILPPRAMLRMLSAGLALLTGGARDLPARQQTLSSTVAWSYNLLKKPEQQLFRRLAVFAGGFTFEACEVVCNADSSLGIGTLDGIAALVENSLVRLDVDRDVEPRFALLRTIRDYISERLAESGEELITRRRHAFYCRDLAMQAEPALVTAEQEAWVRRLEEENDNLRAALQWCMAQDDRELDIVALSLVGSLWRFWWMRGYLTEGRSWIERALHGADRTTASGAGEPEVEALKAKALRGLGNLAWSQTDYPAARSLYEEALAIYRKQGDEREVGSSLNNLGNVYADMGQPGEAKLALEESLVIARRAGYDTLAAVVLGNLGGLAIDQGDYERGRAATTEALKLERAAGNTVGVAQSLTNLGIISVALGEYGRAHQELADALQLNREVGADLNTAFAIEALGVLACDEQEYAKARALHLEALAIRLELGHKAGVVECLRGLAEVAVATKESERAARLYGACDALREEMGASLFHSTRKRFERFSAAGRAQMGDAAWEEASRRGRGLSLEQAVAVARGEG